MKNTMKEKDRKKTKAVKANSTTERNKSEKILAKEGWLKRRGPEIQANQDIQNW